jgi:mannan endo-1,4-beta-mannosidase
MNHNRRILNLCAAACLLLAAGASAAAALNDAEATPGTKAVYDWLQGIHGKQTLAGQQDLSWDDSVDMAQRVFDDTGKYPALMGFDFMNTGMRGPKAQGLHQV